MSSSAASSLAGLVFLVASIGCSRAPVTDGCPDVAPGDLVVSELSAQRPETGTAAWIEVFNASGVDLDLAGVRVDVRKLDGSDAGSHYVRGTTEVARDAYAVLPVASAELPTTAAVDVVACGELVDRVIYHGLPERGTLGLDGAVAPPSADANDIEANLCIDDAEPAGTPGEANASCG